MTPPPSTPSDSIPSVHQRVSHHTRREFLQTSLAALSGFALSSCGWTLADVRAAPREQKASDVLHIYTWANYTDDDLLAEFTAQTGFRVVRGIFGANEEMLAKIQAGGGGQYSIIYPSDYMVAQMIELKLLRPLDPSRLAGLDNLLPKFLDSPNDPGNKYSIPVSWGTTGLVYNADKIKDEPKDWRYLWENKDTLSRKISLLDDVREVMGATLRMLGYSYNSKNPKELEAAFKKLVELKPAISTITTDAWKDPLIAGDLYIAMAYSVDALSAAKENPNLRYVIPQSGTSLWNDRMVIPRTAPNIDAAYAWLNYMLEPSVAAQLSERLLFATPNQAAYEVLPISLQEDKNLFPSDALLAKSENIEPLGTFSEVYENYWTRLAVS